MVMKNSVDEKLEAMGDQKEARIKEAIGDGNGVRLAELEVDDLVRLFGTDDEVNPYIYPDAPNE